MHDRVFSHTQSIMRAISRQPLMYGLNALGVGEVHDHPHRIHPALGECRAGAFGEG